MKKLVKPTHEEAITVLAYDNENCTNENCGCYTTSGGGGNSTAVVVGVIGAAATIGAACIGALCT